MNDRSCRLADVSREICDKIMYYGPASLMYFVLLYYALQRLLVHFYPSV